MPLTASTTRHPISNVPAQTIIEPSVPSPDHPHLTHPAQTAWQTHHDAGRLGANPPAAPHVAAARDHMTALFAKPGSVW